MYYPKSQIISNQYSKGELVVASTGETYIGDYWSTITGKYFTGKNPTSLNSPTELKLSPGLKDSNTPPPSDLIPQNYNITYKTLKYLQLKNIKSSIAPGLPRYSSPFLTEKDYATGEFTRLFCKKKNEGLFLEINKKTYEKLIYKNKSIYYKGYIPFTLPWVLTGDKEQVALENKNAVNYKENIQNLYGLNKYLNYNYLQFYNS